MNQHKGQSRMRHAGRYASPLRSRRGRRGRCDAGRLPGARPGLVAVEQFRPLGTRGAKARRSRDEPVYRDPQAPSQYPPSQHPSSEYPSSDQPPPSAPPAANWSTKNPICLQLEQRLVQEGQRTNQSRDAIPKLEADIRQVDQVYQSSERELERRSCYEYFLFSKSLRRTRACVDLRSRRTRPSASSPTSRRSASRSPCPPSSSYRDDIVRELAHNNCGANYVQEARRRTAARPHPSGRTTRRRQLRKQLVAVRGRLVRHLSHAVRPPLRRLLFPGELLDAAEPLRAGRGRVPLEVRGPRRALLLPEPRRRR